ncbi:BEL1-like homeodomain protein 1 [Sesamum indicum]|uniref:BEL1-like homeodomain protein 1 n=1 Tax=Sesamum indicum TaxID=4182 RepID=A0A6I9TW19_SESIN|nr:BEL1-like homeodomain protein 1 [Sesamum indicum]XP_011090302.1 BEL1-like homeodomain protein 1 [Sesamum indicum]
MYFQGSSEIQADALQTLYLMNPNYVGYSDNHHQPQPNILFSNSATAATVQALNPALMHHAPPAQAQHFVGIPLSHDPSRPSSVLGQQEDIQATHSTIPRFQYNIRGLFDQAATGNQTNVCQQTHQGLSLSLSPHQTGFDHGQSSIRMVSPKNCSSPSLTTTDQTNEVNTMQSVIIGSKYLKAAQELLDELANVQKETPIGRPEAGRMDKAKAKAKITKESTVGDEDGNKGGGADLTTAQRQEIQMKKAKLSSLLDEVEHRCRQYHHQMQIVVASFEQVAGIGSAKSYTQLALKTILKQFRCLKAKISAQIKALNKSLGEEESFGDKFEGSRLKYVDHQLRQQRALQQLGMVQNSAWRPQRGLPERAVSVLRAWLFEHFLHPYPKDSDKQMLARQTGLTRSQDSNWFINARVRLWKPMVEEMYLEETKNQEQISASQDNTPKELGSKSNTRPEHNSTRTARIDHHQQQLNDLQSRPILNLQVPSPTEISASTVITPATGPTRPGFAQLISPLNTQSPPEKKRRNEAQDNSPSSILSVEMEMKGRETKEDCFPGPYGIGEVGRFNNFQGNNFSLTLALPPSETSQGAEGQYFLSRVNGMNQAAGSNPGYENILDFQGRKPFRVQLLPDFVA